MSKKIVVPVVFGVIAFVGSSMINSSYPSFAEKCISEKSHEFLTEQCKEKLANLV